MPHPCDSFAIFFLSMFKLVSTKRVCVTRMTNLFFYHIQCNLTKNLMINMQIVLGCSNNKTKLLIYHKENKLELADFFKW